MTDETARVARRTQACCRRRGGHLASACALNPGRARARGAGHRQPAAADGRRGRRGAHAVARMAQPSPGTPHERDGAKEVVRDAFVSYAREDRPFVKALAEALQERGKKVWLDLEDILPTADWVREVEAGIRSANAFVFVLSPDSARSPRCAAELAHAVEHRKRLIPVKLRDVPDEEVDPRLATPNWVL